MRIAGITLQKQKQVAVGLTYVYGIGAPRARHILALAKIDGKTKVGELTQEQEEKIRSIVEAEYTVEGDLKREIAGNIKRLKDIKCYRGIRHNKHLPVRGQRTKTNSRTVRGNKRNIAPSGKKAVAQKT